MAGREHFGNRKLTKSGGRSMRMYEINRKTRNAKKTLHLAKTAYFITRVAVITGLILFVGAVGDTPDSTGKLNIPMLIAAAAIFLAGIGLTVTAGSWKNRTENILDSLDRERRKIRRYS